MSSQSAAMQAAMWLCSAELLASASALGAGSDAAARR